MQSLSARWLSKILKACWVLGLGASVCMAQDIGNVITLPDQPFILPVPDSRYVFPAYQSEDVLTQRNDNNRTGASYVRGLNQDTVKEFKKLAELKVNGVVLAQPLFAKDVTVLGRRKSVLIVATATNHVYAFSLSHEELWHWPLAAPRNTLSGPDEEHPHDHPELKCRPSEIAAWLDDTVPDQHGPERVGYFGIEATPVIDLQGNQIIVSYKTEDGLQHLSALDLNSGGVRHAEFPFDRSWHNLHHNRASLLLSDGVVFVAFAGFCEGLAEPFHGSILAFDPKTLRHLETFHVTENGVDGGGIWQGSTGIAADTRGNLYFATGNRRVWLKALDQFASADHFNLSNSVVRVKTKKIFSPDGTYKLKMQLGDYFTPYRRLMDDRYDLDLGSAGVLLIPASRYLVMGGKEGVVYVLDRANMGRWDQTDSAWRYAGVDALPANRTFAQTPDDVSHDNVHQKFQAGENTYEGGAFSLVEWMRWPHIHGTPVFARFGMDERSYMFVWAEKDQLKRYQWSQTKFQLPPAQSGPAAPPYVTDKLNGMQGGMLSVNIDPSEVGRGVLFSAMRACDDLDYRPCDRTQDFGILRAFDPISMTEVWNDRMEKYWHAKFVPPTVAAGRVYLATASGKVMVYGRQ